MALPWLRWSMGVEAGPRRAAESRPQSQGVIRPRQNPGPTTAFNPGRRPERKSIQGGQRKVHPQVGRGWENTEGRADRRAADQG